jgi:type I restriction enzyme S subunit
MNNEGNNKIMENSNNWVDEKTKKILSLFLFPENSIVFAKIGAAIFLERKKILCFESCLDNNMMGFIFNCNLINHQFIYYLFHTIKLGSLVSTTALPSLNNKELEQLQFKFPKIDEQTAIAQILSDMDSDIQTLETQRNKTQAIKQGMMQELLTGKTRLI